MTTGTPLVTTSKTADRRRDCSTTLAELVGVVAPHLEADFDLLVAVADLVGQAEDPEQVDVALDGGLDLGQVHAACRGDVGQAGRQAGGQGMEHELDRGRGAVGADEHGRVVGVVDVHLLVRHLLHGAVEAVDRGLVVRAADPPVRGAELELGDVAVALDGVKGGEQRRRVDAVADGVLHGGHVCAPRCWDDLRRSTIVLGACSSTGRRHIRGQHGFRVARVTRTWNRECLLCLSVQAESPAHGHLNSDASAFGLDGCEDDPGRERIRHDRDLHVVAQDVVTHSGLDRSHGDGRCAARATES